MCALPKEDKKWGYFLYLFLSKDKRNPENALKARARSQKERKKERKKERDDGGDDDDDDDEKYPPREDRSKRDAQTTLLDRVGDDGERLRNVIEDV